MIIIIILQKENMVMLIDMKDNLKEEKNMEKENIIIKMEIYMMGIRKMIKEKGQEYILLRIMINM